MKWCPKCGRSYDDEMSFCLEDGTVLSSSMHRIPQETQVTVVSNLGVPADRKAADTKKLVIVSVVIFLFLAFAGVLGLFFFASSWIGKNEPANNKGQELSSLKDSNSKQKTESDVNSNKVSKNDKESLDEEESLDNGELGKDKEKIEDNLNSKDKKVSKREDFVEDLEDDKSGVTSKKDLDSDQSKVDRKIVEREKSAKEEKSLSGSYSGSAMNLSVGKSGRISIEISQRGNDIGGWVNIAKPFAGSGKMISGYTDGKSISFTSYDGVNGVTIYWEGKIKGNVIEGTYTASTTNPYVYPNPQYGTWRVKRK